MRSKRLAEQRTMRVSLRARINVLIPPCVASPRSADAIAQVQKARQIAAEFEFDNGYPQPVAYLAKKMADENQIYTQASPPRLGHLLLLVSPA